MDLQLPKPEIKVEGEKLQVSVQLLSVDLDADGARSVDFKLVGEVDKAEVAQELMGKLLASDKIPAIIKQLLGLK